MEFNRIVLPTATSNIHVNYNGFTADAERAFQYAVDIWESLIISPVTIEVQANWAALGKMASGLKILGRAGPKGYVEGKNVPNAPFPYTAYPSALANLLAGKDLDPVPKDGKPEEHVDTIANFASDNVDSSGNSLWYFGLDGKPLSNQLDFVSTVLHEIGHSLGFASGMQFDTATKKGSWNLSVFDQFIKNGSNQSLIDTNLFVNNSTDLGTQLTSDQLFLDSPAINLSNRDGKPAKLYVPTEWTDSSISHLDENQYNPTSDALMTPNLSLIHQPGAITFRLFQAMGWNMNTEGWIFGTYQDETLAGTDANQNIFGLDGADTLDGKAGDDALNGGNGTDSLYGQAGNDILYGGGDKDNLDGGSGDDVMAGENGDDSYYVDSAGDVVSESPNSGNADIVYASVDYSLSDHVENLALVEGSGAISGTGNSALNIITGNSNGNILDGKAGGDTLIGGAGDDIYFVDDISDRVTEIFSEGTDNVYSSISYELGDNLEDLTLIGDSSINGEGNGLSNNITGNENSNYLDGNDNIDYLYGAGGGDSLDGGLGDDYLFGGLGDDDYYIDSTDDTAIESFDEGIDTVYASASYTLSENLENLNLSDDLAINGTGNSLGNTITGNNADNSLKGMNGNDTLIGRAGKDFLNGGSGDDIMQGGLDDDTYSVDSLNDQVTEAVNEGTDLVNAAITYSLGDHLEDLTLTGNSAIDGKGNSLSNKMTGNSANNFLYGDTADDILIGKAGNDRLDGGSGSDSMSGGLGDDIYVIDSLTDQITENLDEGLDTIESSTDYSLGNNLENLTLTGNKEINGMGNNLKNMIIGNSANNTLAGGLANDTLIGAEGDDILDGGLGTDSMSGGLGNDTYLVDNTTDAIIEQSDEGIDLVQSTASYTLSENLENLTLAGDKAINAVGNSLDNIITGNTATNYLYASDGNDIVNSGAGNDYLYGENGNDALSGAEGNDSLDGGLGDDSIFGDTGDDLLLGNLGNDVLSGGDGKDYLLGDMGNDSLSGGIGNDHLTGGMGDDILAGGADKDWLTGGVGTDQFVLRSWKQKTDIITDFRIADSDRILVSAKGFGKTLKLGTLAADQFTLGAKAQDANDHFIYSSSTGKLFFDADGTGSRKQVQVAMLSNGALLSNRDIAVTL